MTRVLALDWGQRRIGVAFSEGFLAQPYTVIERRSRQIDYERIADLVSKLAIEELVIGLPYAADPQNPVSAQVKTILKHARNLAVQLPVPVKTVDEAYSTVDASELLERSGRQKKVAIDAAAAAVILQRYLDQDETGTRPENRHSGLAG